jgi:hypothetical protein
MLTSYQVETVAVLTEYGELRCLRCWDDNARPVSRYEVDEFDQSVWEYFYDYEVDGAQHVSDCECTVGVYCASCSEELSEPYTDPKCGEKNGGVIDG